MQFPFLKFVPESLRPFAVERVRGRKRVEKQLFPLEDPDPAGHAAAVNRRHS